MATKQKTRKVREISRRLDVRIGLGAVAHGYSVQSELILGPKYADTLINNLSSLHKVSRMPAPGEHGTEEKGESDSDASLSFDSALTVLHKST